MEKPECSRTHVPPAPLPRVALNPGSKTRLLPGPGVTGRGTQLPKGVRNVVAEALIE